MINYSNGDIVITEKELSKSPSMLSISAKSKYNEFYDKKKQLQKLSKHDIESNAEKYLPPNLRSARNSESNTKSHPIALSPAYRENIDDKKEENEKHKIVIHSAARLRDNDIELNSPTYQELQVMAMQHAYNLRTSSDREIALKRIVGAQGSRVNPLILHPTGTLPLYQTDDFSYEQRTKCMAITGTAIVSVMVIFVAILTVMGYS